jgi:ATP-dependent DNA helicase RecG
MKGEEKSRILTAFKAHELDVLVSTPVVEVGIDVANATIMAIETADRFGLAQLHQLRGRVGRGQKKSYCLLFSESENETALTRLKALQETTDGAKLAEVDLSLRGPGEIFGTRQSGFAELKIARWDDIELIKQAKSFAQTIFASKSDFTDYLSYLAYRQKASN